MTGDVPVRSLDLEALERDPFPIWEQLRHEAPVVWVPELHGHFVTRFDDVVRVARDAETFSAAVHSSPLSRTLGPNLLHADDPEHAEQRAPVTRRLRPASVHADLRPLVDSVLEDLVASLRGRDEVDLVAELADPLAHQVLRAVIGLPELGAADMRRWVQGVGAGASNFHRDPAVEAAAGEVCAEIDDVLRTALAAGPPAGSMLDMLSAAPFQQVSSTVKLLVIGGLQEPRDLFGLAALAYLRDDDVRRAVDVEPEAMVPRLVEETLRWGSPVGTITRVTTRPVVLSGVELPAGAVVAGVLASANRDPARWTQPDTFDLQRGDLHHLAFAAGVHTCAGATLARLEVQRALHALLPLGAELAEDPEVRGWEFRGPLTLPVRLRRVAVRRDPRTTTAHEVRVASVANLSDDVVGLTLVGEDLPPWTPGAHIDVLLPSGLCRQYSLCGPRAAQEWHIAVRRAPDSRGGSAWLHAEAQAGTALQVRGPRNNFPLRAGPALFIAGGIGITPLLPMVEAAAEQGARWHLHYLHRGAPAPFQERLGQYGDRVTLHDTSTADRPAVAALLAGATDGVTVYCCGPHGLIADIVAAAPLGCRVQVEHFAAPAGTGVGASEDRPFTVRLASSGRELSVAANETVLDALERNGVLVPSSCREGVCGSCEVPLLSGDAEHRGALPVDGSTFLPCVSRANGDDLVLDL